MLTLALPRQTLNIRDLVPVWNHFKINRGTGPWRNLEILQTDPPELHGSRERLVLGDGEDQQEALATAEVVIPNGGVVLLTRRVQDVDLDLLAVQDYLLPVAVRLGGLVVFHELQRFRGAT